jgi:hypothetical protein
MRFLDPIESETSEASGVQIAAESEADLLAPAVSYHALKKAMRVIQEMVLYYFPLHDLDPKDFFRVMPTLIFTEALIYQDDEEYEAGMEDPLAASPRLELLKRILGQAGIYDEALAAELQRGIDYWRLERAICSGASFTETDISAATRFKCCDYRFLHRLLFRLLDKPYDEELLDLSWLVEQTGEIEDDLAQYAEDVENDVYNTYRMFVRLYGTDAPRRLRAHLDTLNEDAERRVVQLAATRPALAERWEDVQNRYYQANPAPAIPEAIPEGAGPLSSPTRTPTTAKLLTPTISFKAFSKALRIVEELVVYYFPLHGMDDRDIFPYLTPLIYGEATVYQIDEEYEAHLGDPGFASPHADTLREVLNHLGLYDEALEGEFQCGKLYWDLERRLCGGGPVTEADIRRIGQLRCADYRFLHRLLFRLLQKPYDEDMIALCSLLEQRGEIEDDLRQYYEDIPRNVYNTYRMYVRLYGSTAPEHLQRYLEQLDETAEQYAQRLALAEPKWISLGRQLQQTYYEDHPPPPIPSPILEWDTEG